MKKIAEVNAKIDELRNKIKGLKQDQENIELSDIFSEDRFEKEVIREIYEYENIKYHMRKIDETMFNEEYNNYLDGLISDGFIENTDEYKEIQEEIESLEDEILDLEDEIEALEDEIVDKSN